MGNAQQINPETWLVVIQELLKTPGVKSVSFVQLLPVSAPILGPDQKPRTVPEVEEYRQTFNAGEWKTGTPVTMQPTAIGIVYEVHGFMPREWVDAGWLISPGSGFMPALVEIREKRPMPITLIWNKYNIHTGEYYATSVGPPMLRVTDGPVKTDPALQ